MAIPACIRAALFVPDCRKYHFSITSFLPSRQYYWFTYPVLFTGISNYPSALGETQLSLTDKEHDVTFLADRGWDHGLLPTNQPTNTSDSPFLHRQHRHCHDCRCL
ncbi:hypothetical protein XSR1_280007 [Xenorhabdus szentirmaii DSM 16338]|uniref:Uncharacterized protein n=1 Tax=Xenorhabdus szentirmaii DSM 16338 TaxID=1427518 RepID=W1IX51_9GAMM|nr:hypothetical protein XSR1_280007 [Xenorhabdus szentirmaii DSM 16338]